MFILAGEWSFNVTRRASLRQTIKKNQMKRFLGEVQFRQSSIHQYQADPNHYIKLYLLCPEFTRFGKKGQLPKTLVRMLSAIDKYIVRRPVFFNKRSALRHARFMGPGHGVLKVSIAEAAVEGRQQGLLLRHGFLNSCNVHGYYPNPSDENLYIENPAFSRDLLGVTVVTAHAEERLYA